MNMQSLPTLISLILATSAFGAVSQSGDWTSTNTWSDSTVPGLSSDAPLPILSFESTGLELTVNADVWANMIDVGTTQNATINVLSGNTLTLLGNASSDDPKEIFYGTKDFSEVIFNGEGTVKISSATERNLGNGIWTFNAAVSQGNATLFLANEGVLNINGGWTSTGQLSASHSTINVNSNFSTSSAFNIWGASSTLNIAEGVSVNCGGFGMVSGTVKGNIVANSYNGSDQYSISFGRKDGARATILFENATIESKSTTMPSLIRNANMTINAGEGAIKTANQMYWFNTTITLNSSNVFYINGQTQQSESIINIATYAKGTISSSTADLILGADNDFGGFKFQEGSTLNITSNGHNVNIGGFFVDSEGTSFNINIYNLTDFTLKIGSLDNIATEVDGDGFLRTREGFMVSSDEFFLDYAYLVKADDGGYWVNVTSAVPEPAECAMILGALACALAFAKRRIGK